jgi:hypothetical protein
VAARRPAVLVVLVSVLAGATGCSFGMRTAPSDPAQRTRKAAQACVADMYYPFFDTVSAGVGVYNIHVSLAARDRVSIYGVEMSKKAGHALGITQAALFGIGALYGYVQLARCSELSREKRLDTTRGTVVNGEWHPARVRSNRADSDSTDKGATSGDSTPSEGTAPGSENDRSRHLAPGSEDDRPRHPAPGREDDRPRPPAPGTQGAGSAELPSWSAFRRYPLPPENPPRGPATGNE